jgi:group I intron endonuclease
MKNDKSSGIYKITCVPTKKVYIGKTVNFHKRYLCYLSDFRRKTNRVNQYLTNAVAKYGIENFTFEVIEYCSVSQLIELEFKWMKHYDSINSDKGFNLRFDSSSASGVSELTKNKISKRVRREWSEGARSNHSSKLKENWSINSERKASQSKLLSVLKTKYKYSINGSTNLILYSDLVLLGLKYCFYKFARKNSDEITYKGYNIRRIPHESQA